MGQTLNGNPSTRLRKGGERPWLAGRLHCLSVGLGHKKKKRVMVLVRVGLCAARGGGGGSDLFLLSCSLLPLLSESGPKKVTEAKKPLNNNNCPSRGRSRGLIPCHRRTHKTNTGNKVRRRTGGGPGLPLFLQTVSPSFLLTPRRKLVRPPGHEPTLTPDPNFSGRAGTNDDPRLGGPG